MDINEYGSYNQGLNSGIATDEHSYIGLLHRNLDIQIANNGKPNRPSAPSAPPKSLSEAMTSGFYGGAALAAIATFMFFGVEQMASIIVWTLCGAVGGAVLILALRILAFLIDVALKIIGWGLVICMGLYFLGFI